MFVQTEPPSICVGQSPLPQDDAHGSEIRLRLKSWTSGDMEKAMQGSGQDPKLA